MKTHSNRWRAYTALFIAVFASLALAVSAQAKLTGEYTKYEQCPISNVEVIKCLYSVTESGEVVLGSKKVPIEKPVVVQGGIGVAVKGVSPFFGASNGVTISKTPQAVPGGLAGLINCKAIKEPFIRFACELTFENGVTGLSSTLELAGSASGIKISESHLISKTGVALSLPVKFHLENPFLGSECYVGSNSSPIAWELTTGTTSPPPPNEAIQGAGGTATFLEEGRIIQIKGTKLVENAWSAPGVHGCGGFLVELVLDPIINAAAGLPAAAGHNTAILNNTLNVASAAAVEENDAENP
jgi:hypothetical protein